MKKQLIALAVAGALTAPMIAQADATLYGTAQYRGVKAKDTSFDNKMAKTRLGVKGTVDNDIEGLTTGFQFEWEFSGNGAITGTTDSAATSVRKSQVYMKGGFGIAAFGRQNNPVNAAEAMTDILGNDSAAFHQVPDRIGKSAAYISPMFGGAEVYVGVGADGEAKPSKSADVTLYGVNWSGMGFGVSAGVVDVADQPALSTPIAGLKMTSVGVSYSGVENLYVAANMTKNEADAGGSAEATNVDVAASYTIGKVTLAAIHAQYEPTKNATKQKQTLVGVRYALGAKASVGVDYASYNAAAETAGSKDTLVLEYTLSF